MKKVMTLSIFLLLGLAAKTNAVEVNQQNSVLTEKMNQLMKVKTYHLTVWIPGLGNVHATLTDFGGGHYYVTVSYMSGGVPKTLTAEFYTHRTKADVEEIDTIEFEYDSPSTETEFINAGGEGILVDALNVNFE